MFHESYNESSLIHYRSISMHIAQPDKNSLFLISSPLYIETHKSSNKEPKSTPHLLILLRLNLLQPMRGVTLQPRILSLLGLPLRMRRIATVLRGCLPCRDGVLLLGSGLALRGWGLAAWVWSRHCFLVLGWCFEVRRK